jgi:NADH-quinone oxidoreductase subunit N
VIEVLAQAPVRAPEIDWEALSPLIALTVGLCVVLLVGLLRSLFARTTVVPVLAGVTLGATAGLAISQWDRNVSIISGAVRIDNLTLALTLVFCVAATVTVVLALRSGAARDAGEGEWYALLLTAVLGMVVLAGAQNLVTVFVGYELLSIPLYVLCATHLRREHSLEAGLKYLIVGSVGSATLLYGLAMLYGATGGTSFNEIFEAVRAESLGDDPLFLTAVALIVAGIAFKASVAPFHQWTPDVYEGAPTTVTTFMAVATKAAALGIALRLFDVALIGADDAWAPALAALAVTTILIGNVGAIGQSSVKRILAYSSVAQAGYMLVGVIVGTRLGIQAVVFYLFAYLVMNVAAFAVVIARERETGLGDDIAALRGLGADRPLLAWPITIAMLSLAGFPATIGFFGKIYLIRAAVQDDWAWLGVAIVVGSAISLAYYLRVVAVVWMRGPEDEPVAIPTVAGRPVMAGGAPEADDAQADLHHDRPGHAAVASPGHVAGDDHVDEPDDVRDGQPEIVAVAVLAAIAAIVFGIYPEPLFDVARDVGSSFPGLP